MPISARIKNHLEEKKGPRSSPTHPSCYTAGVAILRTYRSLSTMCIGHSCPKMASQ
jgi:hypothetical protein